MDLYSFTHDTKIISTNIKDCQCKKELPKSCECSTPNKTPEKIQLIPQLEKTCFAVNNYFSELLSDWEQATARANLGIQELINIEYALNEDETLGKVKFIYKKGHEVIIKEFDIAPKGDKGDYPSWLDMPEELKEELKGDKGDPAKLGTILISWLVEGTPYGTTLYNEATKKYDMHLYLNLPDSIKQLPEIVRAINELLIPLYASKEYVEEKLNDLASRVAVTVDLQRNGDNLIVQVNNNSKTIKLPTYNLKLVNSELQLTKDNNTVATVNVNIPIASRTTVGGIKTNFSGDGYPVKVDPEGNAYVSKTSNLKLYYKLTSNYNIPPEWNDGYGWITEPIADVANLYVWCAIVINDICQNRFRITPVNGKDGLDGLDGVSAALGLSGAVIRIRGEYTEGTTYYNYANDTTLSPLSIRYMDVVYVKNGNVDPSKYQWFLVKPQKTTVNHGLRETQTSPTLSTENWEMYTSISYAYITNLIADYANIANITSKEITIVNSANLIVAGMTSSHLLVDVDSEDPVRIWAGTTTSVDDGIENINLATAAFKVTENGYLTAKNATISGELNVSSLNLINDERLTSYYEDAEEIVLLDTDKHSIVYIITHDVETKITTDNVHLYILTSDGQPTLAQEEVTLEKQSLYILIHTNKGWRLQLLPLFTKKETTGGTIPAYGTARTVNSTDFLEWYCQDMAYDNQDLETLEFEQVNSSWGYIKIGFTWSSEYPLYKIESTEAGLVKTEIPGSTRGGTWTHQIALTEDNITEWKESGKINISPLSTLIPTNSPEFTENKLCVHEGILYVSNKFITLGGTVLCYVELPRNRVTTFMVYKALSRPEATVLQNGCIVLNGKIVGEKQTVGDTKTFINFEKFDYAVKESNKYAIVLALSQVVYDASNTEIWKDKI